MATIIGILSAVHGIAPYTLWHSTPKSSPFWDEASRLKEPVHRFVGRTRDRFFETGSVDSKKYKRRSKKPTAMPDDEARLAATYLKLGHWVPVVSRNGTSVRLVHRYYATVAAAVKHCPELRGLRDKYHLTNKKLLYYMKTADPKLLRRRVHIKYGFDKEELAERQRRANSLWQKCDHDPSWLDRTYFIDECSIWIDNEMSKGIKVYVDAHDRGFHHVIHYDKLHKNKKIKVRFIAAVNATHGAAYLEFTTGTTKIQRVHNTLPADPQHGPYKVNVCKHSLLDKHYVAKCSSVNPEPWQAAGQQLCICQQLPILVHVYSAVPRGQHNAFVSSSKLDGCCQV
jgi:hypothetical protein